MIRKAVFPVAGLGTRFLPATKANPKEMMPVVDKPLIQYAVEEAILAGIKQLIFVTSSGKRAIENHFDTNHALESELEAKNKTKVLEYLRGMIPDDVSCVYIRQAKALGLGHAVLCAKDVVGNSAFAVILADDLIDDGGKGCLSQMTAQYEKYQASILGVERIEANETDKYGIVSTEAPDNHIASVNAIVEKPKPELAPSNLAVVGRYILTPTIFKLLEKTGTGAGGEIQLTDAIAALLNEEKVMAYEFSGHRYDCGSKLGYLQATVEFGLKHPELKDEFMTYLHSYCLPNIDPE